jgi:hypothetical protein
MSVLTKRGGVKRHKSIIAERTVHGLSNSAHKFLTRNSRFAGESEYNSANGSIFQERWWLDAVAPCQWKEVTIKEEGRIVGRLPYFETRRFGLATLGMPPLTRTLGPWIAPGTGKAVTLRQRETRLVRELIERMPRHDYFCQLLPTNYNNLLPFQCAGFTTSLEHVIEIDCGFGANVVWDEMHHKVRSLIRRAEQSHIFDESTDPEDFFRFYDRNITLSGRRNHFDAQTFLRLYRACREQEACSILALRNASGDLAAAVFLVWSPGRMYFHMQTRDPASAAAGAVEYLIWNAVKKAAARGMILDLDGIPNQITAHRLLSFGGELRSRAVISRGSALAIAARHFRRAIYWKLGNKTVFC